MSKRNVSASNFVATVAANVNNGQSDKAFRQFVKNSLPIVVYQGAGETIYQDDGKVCKCGGRKFKGR